MIALLAESPEEFQALQREASLSIFSCEPINHPQQLRGRRYAFALATPRWFTNPVYDKDFLVRLRASCGALFVLQGVMP